MQQVITFTPQEVEKIFQEVRDTLEFRIDSSYYDTDRIYDIDAIEGFYEGNYEDHIALIEDDYLRSELRKIEKAAQLARNNIHPCEYRNEVIETLCSKLDEVATLDSCTFGETFQLFLKRAEDFADEEYSILEEFDEWLVAVDRHLYFEEYWGVLANDVIIEIDLLTEERCQFNFIEYFNESVNKKDGLDPDDFLNEWMEQYNSTMSDIWYKLIEFLDCAVITILQWEARKRAESEAHVDLYFPVELRNLLRECQC